MVNEESTANPAPDPGFDMDQEILSRLIKPLADVSSIFL
jgi:hypothetical protein